MKVPPSYSKWLGNQLGCKVPDSLHFLVVLESTAPMGRFGMFAADAGLPQDSVIVGLQQAVGNLHNLVSVHGIRLARKVCTPTGWTG
jgi:hypothetical protein